MVEDFFDLKSTRKYYKPQPLVVLPATCVAQPAQTREREDTGTEYARLFKAKASKCMAQVSDLNTNILQIIKTKFIKELLEAQHHFAIDSSII